MQNQNRRKIMLKFRKEIGVVLTKLCQFEVDVESK